ncbi:MAG: hypothetical protein IJH52_07575 [Oscillospiraceae bacterium]|nr:hypothetical protein [Oscillospiraceae bacterium]
MILHLSRKLHLFRSTYQIRERGDVQGTGRNTLDLLFHRLKLLKNGELLYEMRQTNLFLQILAAIPILGLAVFVPFQLFFNGKKIGRSRRLSASAGYEIAFGDDRYEIHLHNDNRCSVVKNGAQIALIAKNEEVWFEENEYEVLLPDNCGEAEQSRIFLLGMFIDVTFFANHRRWSAHKKEKNIVLFDAFPERADWTPDEIGGSHERLE